MHNMCAILQSLGIRHTKEAAARPDRRAHAFCNVCVCGDGAPFCHISLGIRGQELSRSFGLLLPCNDNFPAEIAPVTRAGLHHLVKR